jgi:hypothetical protein
MGKLALVCFATGMIVAAGGFRPSEARVVRFVVEQTRSFAEGMSFGDVGPYERLDGTAYMEVDPRDPLNAGIVNLQRPPEMGGGWWSSARRSSS